METDPKNSDQTIRVTNEFADVRVRKVQTPNGERLEIVSEKADSAVRLDALVLESLTWQPIETFSELLETPLGRE